MNTVTSRTNLSTTQHLQGACSDQFIILPTYSFFKVLIGPQDDINSSNQYGQTLAVDNYVSTTIFMSKGMSSVLYIIVELIYTFHTDACMLWLINELAYCS